MIHGLMRRRSGLPSPLPSRSKARTREAVTWTRRPRASCAATGSPPWPSCWRCSWTCCCGPWAKPTAFPLFTAAVLFASWYGGLGPGLLATALATVAGRYFFTEPYYTFTVDAGVLVRLAMFAVMVAATTYATNARRRSERALGESEGRYRTLTEALPQLVWTCRPDGSCDYLSRQWVEYTGVPEDEQLGMKWLDRVIHPEDRERAFSCWTAAVEGRGAYDLEYRIRRGGRPLSLVPDPWAPAARRRRGHRQVVRHLHGHRREEACRGGAPGGEGGRRGGQSGQGRLPRRPLARTPHAPDPGPADRLGPALRPEDPRGAARRTVDGPAERRDGGPADRRPAGPDPDRAGQAGVEVGGRQPPRHRPARRDDLPARDRGEGADADPGPAGEAASRAGRRGAAPAGPVEPAQERRQVHARGGDDRPRHRGRGLGRAPHPGQRHGHRHPARGPAPAVPRLRAGRPGHHQAVRRARARAGDLEGAGGRPRRHHPGRQRGAWEGGHVHGRIAGGDLSDRGRR